MPHTALIIDDEADIRELIAMSLDRIGLETHTAGNLAEARNLLNTYKFDVCLTDMKLPDGNGVEFVKYVLSVQPALPVAVITAHGNMNAAVEAMKNGAFDFVSKPVDIKLLRSLVTQAVSLQSDLPSHSEAVSKSETFAARVSGPTDSSFAPHKNEGHIAQEEAGTSNYLNRHCEPDPSRLKLIGEERLIGESEPMRELKKMIGKVARTNAPVWITGESGTGKELIAKLVHENGPRANAPFVAINCGAIPSELMESEMFGHRKGSFTGAHSDHDGLFKRAEGGTLFLDEVAELPLHMQVKLLRAIQERAIRPVGSSEEIGTDVRILSASHKDLAIEVEQGRFRHDLYYRLNVICLRAPSLRQRREDVAMIARHVLDAISLKDGLSELVKLSTGAEDLLCEYQFPGNVRELENILERAVALCEHTTIEASDLNLVVAQNHEPAQLDGIHTGAAANDSGDRQLILDTLALTRWNRKAAAVQLGLTYRQLRYRIQQFRIDEDETGT